MAIKWRWLRGKYGSRERAQVIVSEGHQNKRCGRKQELLQTPLGKLRILLAKEEIGHGSDKPHAREEDPEGCNVGTDSGIAGSNRASHGIGNDDDSDTQGSNYIVRECQAHGRIHASSGLFEIAVDRRSNRLVTQ